MKKINKTPGIFIWRITASHTIAYMLAGLFAISVMRYDEFFGVGALSFMRPTDSPWVAAGPGLQVIRGALLALVLIPFRSIFIETKKGWLKFWILTFGLSYLFTLSAATGSFEGVIYTNIPLKFHLIGIPEIVLYITLFSVFMWGWYENPGKIFRILSIVLVTLIVFMSFMGVLNSLNIIPMN
jgi:hypothetical protein